MHYSSPHACYMPCRSTMANSNRQLGITVYMKLQIIIASEQQIWPSQKNRTVQSTMLPYRNMQTIWSEVMIMGYSSELSHSVKSTFINSSEIFLMGRDTITFNMCRQIKEGIQEYSDNAEDLGVKLTITSWLKRLGWNRWYANMRCTRVYGKIYEQCHEAGQCRGQ